MSIKIIGAGLPRTGTNTLKQSLEMLGYTKTYHMKELLVNPDNLKYWHTLESTGTTNWDELYDGYQATVDFPAYPWVKEHLAQYPDAKVIFTTRPFDKWYDSIYSTVWTAGPQNLPQKLAMMSKLIFNPRLRKVIKCIKLAKKRIFKVTLQGKFEDKAFAEKVFNQHLEDMKALVKPENFLIYDVRDGWGPLCKFLGKEEPKDPLPHLNKKENFKTMLVDLMKGNMV
ncbi:MAG: sulfotransferase family protein [Bacteroidota bacterium]